MAHAQPPPMGPGGGAGGMPMISATAVHQFQQQPQQQPMAPAAMQRTLAWTEQHHYGDSGVQSMSHSGVPSVMSGVSSVQDEFAQQPDLTDAQQSKFDGISMYDQQLANAIPELIKLLGDPDLVIVEMASMMVHKFTKVEASQRFNESVIRNTDLIVALRKVIRSRPPQNRPEIVRHVLGALFQISFRSDGLEMMKQVVHASNGAFIVELLQTLSIKSLGTRYGLMLLHNMLSEPQQGAWTCEILQQAGGLAVFVQLLDRDDITTEKLLHVAVDCLYKLYDKSPEEKANFLLADGPSKLIAILRTCQYENLLVRTAQALLSLCTSTQNVRAVVSAGGVSALSAHLGHASQRLVQGCLLCLRNLSDVPCDMDMSELLAKLLQLLGVNDGKIVLYCVEILANVVANNKPNKEFLVRHDALESLSRVLLTARAQQYASTCRSLDDFNILMENVQERTLTTLRHLCQGHDSAVAVQMRLMHVLQPPNAALFYLCTLQGMRPQLLKPTLQILAKTAAHAQNLPLFRTKLFVEHERREVGFPELLVAVLNTAVNEHMQNRVEIEETKVADLIWYSLATIQQLCADEQLFHHALACLKPQCQSTPLLPLFVLAQIQNNENVTRSALGLLSELARDQDIATLLQQQADFLAACRQYAGSQTQAIAAYASKILEQLHFFVDQQQPLYPVCDDLYAPNFDWSSEETDQFGAGGAAGDNPFAYFLTQQESSSQQQRLPPMNASGNAANYDPSPQMDQMHLGSPASPWCSPPSAAPTAYNPPASNNNAYGGY